MTTLTTNPAPRAPSRQAGGATLPRVVRSEWTKLRSLRSTWWMLLISFVLTIGFAAVNAGSESSGLPYMSPGERASLDVTSHAMASVLFGQLALAVLGALTISSEYSTGGVRSTFVAVPNRLLVLLAKSLVLGFIAWVAGTVSAFVSFFVAMAFWPRDMATSLDNPAVLRAVSGAGLIVLAGGLLGLALGTLIRHTAGSITAAFGLLFVLPPLVTALPGGWGHAVSSHFTVNAGRRITEVIPEPGQLSPWLGFSWMLAESLTALLFGAWLLRRRDA
ncbi:ABC transporter permease subunit [Actinoplanes sp. TFC3]|uniref:ABC transporter permease subunit n=1 Tax=Actinoplanes sp. TFC3 TaxID=1710355 RepID=UPI00083158CC|nr:ABC transporter permease subunit [Actinoplanes sp. TFC3]